MCLCGFPASFFVAEFLISFYLCVREVARLTGMQLKSSWGDVAQPLSSYTDLPHPPWAGWGGLAGCRAGEAPTSLAQGWRVQHLAGCRGGGRWEVGGKGMESTLTSGPLSCLGKGIRDEWSLWQGRGTWSVSASA